MRVTIVLSLFCFSISVLAHTDGTGEAAAEQVAIGEYEKLDTLDRIRLATAPYVNRDALDKVAINFIYHPNTKNFDASMFYSDIIDRKVMPGKITDDGKYQIAPPVSSEPWTVSATRTVMPVPSQVTEVTEEVAKGFLDYLQYRKNTEDGSFAPTLGNWYDFVNWYVFAENIDVGRGDRISPEDLLNSFSGENEAFHSASNSIEWKENSPQSWREFVMWYILVGGVQAEMADSYVGDKLLSFYGKDSSSDGNGFYPSYEEASEVISLIHSRTSAVHSLSDVMKGQIQVDSVDQLKEWNVFANWYNDSTAENKIDWAIDFPFDDYAFVGVAPVIGGLRGERVVSWNAETYLDAMNDLSGTWP